MEHLWRPPERIGLGERLVECFDGTRDDAVFAAATILEALDVDPDLPSVLVSRARPMAAFAHVAHRMLASLARERPELAEVADAWRASTVPALRSLDELLGDLHGAESRREAERTLRDRFAREPGLAAELEGRYRARLRSRQKSDASAALHDLSRLARAGIYLALVDEISACAGGTGKSVETAREVLRWLAEAAPPLAPSDAIAILLDPSASPTSYAFRHALASVEHASSTSRNTPRSPIRPMETMAMFERCEGCSVGKQSSPDCSNGPSNATWNDTGPSRGRPTICSCGGDRN